MCGHKCSSGVAGSEKLGRYILCEGVSLPGQNPLRGMCACSLVHRALMYAVKCHGHVCDNVRADRGWVGLMFQARFMFGSTFEKNARLRCA